MAVELDRVRQQVRELDLGWAPGETSNTGLSLLQARSRTGAVPPGGLDALLERHAVATTLRHDEPVRADAAAALPAAVDWRNHGGSWVTPVRDQGYCGSCVAFGTVAVLESMVRLAARAPALDVDLSEAHLFFCYGPGHGAGACPAGGWWADDAYACLGQGVVDDACFPYTDADQKCRLGPDATHRLTTAGAVTRFDDVAAMKRHLATTGPLTACFTIYEDFQSYYTGGIYRYHPRTSGEVVGGHCVAVVGYDDTRRCWIAKNSWGPGWGEQGFFRIGYGEVGFDAEMWGVTGPISSPYLASLQVVGLRGGALRRTARSARTTWDPWETVPTPAGASPFTDVACAGVGSSLQVVGVGQGGTETNLWHSVRSAAGAWQPSFGNVRDPGQHRVFSRVACAAVGSDLQVVGIENGALRHTVRSAGGWQPAIGRLALPRGAGAATAIACTGIGSDFHVLAVVDGVLWHTVRGPSGWSPFGRVRSADGAGPLTDVAAAGVAGALQVVVVGHAGTGSNLWHTIRQPTGSWLPAFGNIKDTAGARSFDAVTCAGVAGELQVLASRDGELWHTIRSARGGWLAAFGHLHGPAGAGTVGFDVVSGTVLR